MGRMHLERWVEPFVFETKLRGKVVDPSMGLSWDDRLAMGREEVVLILRKIWPYLLVGIGVGAVIHGWVPEDWFAEHAVGVFGVPIAVGLGVPLYSNAAGVHAAGRGAARQGPADGHGAGVHDERRRAVAAGDDPAASGAASPG